MPKTEFLKLKSLYLANLNRNLIMANEMVKIITIFENKNITAIPFKGPVLSIQAYGDLGLRSFQDVDILISPKDFFKVYDIMITEGFQPTIPLSKRMKNYWAHAKRDVEFFKPNCFIDFHQRLTQGHISFELTEKEMNGVSQYGTMELE